MIRGAKRNSPSSGRSAPHAMPTPTCCRRPVGRIALWCLCRQDAGHVFSVAQISNLPYRRFVIGRTLLAGGGWQVKNLRYSRLQVCA